ncbi:NAD(P)/FAD-dependent oxidoreductase [Amycolatopsis ultiminotia]|uniref:NAD(P)/FAD-dependent oxidoreductase n=1 Tax=Amycolatopsis ultiminotia TaxID=543629 RepID=A0ABP6XGM2_9PSEU
MSAEPIASTEHFDVLIVGAGLSGVGAAHHLRTAFPDRTYAILEARDALGGTWDLFRYPGVRSDSDMQTLGYRFRPWTGVKSIADGPAILQYIQDTAADAGIDRHIRYGHRVTAASWSTEDALWTVTVEHDGETRQLTTNLLYVCSGYYHYDSGHRPAFPGIEQFGGTVVHPQQWPAELDYADKNVVVIGSGATAVTIVPAMAGQARHVTMLQRSPTYIAAIPGEDKLANRLRALLGDRLGYAVTRWKNVATTTAIYQLSRRRPRLMRSVLRKGAVKLLPPGYDVDRHFRPRYNPWDQRLCLAPDGDLFTAIRRGGTSVVTDEIAGFTETGIRLRSGTELPADVVVTATGLRLLAFGGIRLTVDDRPVQLPETMAYKGMMLSGVPNFVFTVGYTNASWTLKADLVSEYTVRLLRHLDEHGYDQCVPVNDRTDVAERPLLDFQAGYVQRSMHEFPRAGSRRPWRMGTSYPNDLLLLRHGRIDDGALRFRRKPAVHRAAAQVSSPGAPARQ